MLKQIAIIKLGRRIDQRNRSENIDAFMVNHNIKKTNLHLILVSMSAICLPHRLSVFLYLTFCGMGMVCSCLVGLVLSVAVLGGRRHSFRKLHLVPGYWVIREITFDRDICRDLVSSARMSGCERVSLFLYHSVASCLPMWSHPLTEALSVSPSIRRWHSHG